jgi:hypothetical protein
MGTFGVPNGGDPELLLGMSRDTVAIILGRPADSSVGLMIYRFRDITVTVKYVNNAAAQIEIDCDRWVSCDGGNFLVAYDNTKSDMVSRYGQPDRDENLTWWYDARGIGFIYDYFSNPLRIKKAVVYYPNGPPAGSIHLDSLYLANTVDNDADGYLSSFDLCVKVGMPDTTHDSVSFMLYSRPHGTTAWGTPFLSSTNMYIDTSYDVKYASITGADSGSVDYLVEMFPRSGSVMLDSMTLPDVRVETPAEDGL